MKYACFDIGNVLYHVEFGPLLARLSKEFNITVAEANHFLNENQKRCDLGLSLIRGELVSRFNVKSDALLEEMVSLWMGCVQPNGAMLSLFDELQGEGVQLAILSNMGHEHHSQLGSLFNNAVHFFSCIVGARKPTMVYYSTFLAMYPEFKGAIYVDDLQENLNAGAGFGFKPVRFSLESRPTTKDIEDLRAQILA